MNSYLQGVTSQLYYVCSYVLFCSSVLSIISKMSTYSFCDNKAEEDFLLKNRVLLSDAASFLPHGGILFVLPLVLSPHWSSGWHQTLLLSPNSPLPWCWHNPSLCVDVNCLIRFDSSYYKQTPSWITALSQQRASISQSMSLAMQGHSRQMGHSEEF